MKIVGEYSFKGGVSVRQNPLFQEIEQAIKSVYAGAHRTKRSQERTKIGKMLYNPISINESLKKHLKGKGWEPHTEVCVYPTNYYVGGYTPAPAPPGGRRPYREMDFVKEKIGIEAQFGKYSFMVYNVCAKMTIFRNKGIIEQGIEIVPVKEFADEMSAGVSYFEQFVWDLENRGSGNIDIPVLILGIHAAAGETPNDDDTNIARKYEKETEKELEEKLEEDQGHE